MPTLVVIGGLDTEGTRASAERLAAEVPGAPDHPHPERRAHHRHGGARRARGADRGAPRAAAALELTPCRRAGGTCPGAALGSRAGRGSRPNLHAATQPGPLRRDSPFGATRILIDGRNVQRALERGASRRDPCPRPLLIARLRAAFAPPTEVELILDGHAGPTPTGRIAPGFSVVFGRGVSADHVIAERVVEAFRALGPVDSDMVLVVSDDREVRGQALRNGCRVQGTAWLAGHLAARAVADGARGASIGHGRAPRMPRQRQRPRSRADRTGRRLGLTGCSSTYYISCPTTDVPRFLCDDHAARLLRRLPGLRQRARRLAVVGAFTGYPILQLGYWALVAPGQVRTAIWAPIAIVLFAITIVSVFALYGYGQGRMGYPKHVARRAPAAHARSALALSYGIVTTVVAMARRWLAGWAMNEPIVIEMGSLVPSSSRWACTCPPAVRCARLDRAGRAGRRRGLRWPRQTKPGERELVHNRLPLLRADRGMSRTDLADALGIHYQTIGYIERGRVRAEPPPRPADRAPVRPPGRGRLLAGAFGQLGPSRSWWLHALTRAR